MSVEKLKDRLLNDPNKELVNFHVTWGPKAKDMTPDERAQVILDMLDSPNKTIFVDAPNSRKKKMSL